MHECFWHLHEKELTCYALELHQACSTQKNENIWYRENVVELGYENIAPSNHEGILRHCCRATKVATELVT